MMINRMNRTYIQDNPVTSHNTENHTSIDTQ